MTNPTNTTGKTSSQPQQGSTSSVKPQATEAGKKPASGSQTDKSYSSNNKM